MELSVSEERKPNIVMVLIDGGGREDAREKIQSYQSLKKEATFFPNLISYAPYSIASLHALISGMYGSVNGVNGYYRSYDFDKKNVFTLTQYLRSAGYYTQLDIVIEEGLPNQGFHTVKTFGKDPSKEIDLVKRHSQMLAELKDKEPFFLFLDYNKIALKLVPAVIKKYDDFSEKYFKNKEKNFPIYLKWVEESGQYLEKILHKIKELGIYNNTIIIIFSDHGCSIGDKIGEKVYGVYLYDYTIKCYAYFIGKYFQKNLEIKNLVRSIDIMPTILDILKIPIRKNYKKIQGTSLRPLMEGINDERTAYSETGGLGGPTPSPEVHNMQCVRTNEWKLIYNQTNKQRELYNLTEDKGENNNLAGKGFPIEEKLMEELKKIIRDNENINRRFKVIMSRE